MINLIPPKLKQELRYARWNALVVHYLKIVIVLLLILGGAFTSTYIYLGRRITQVDNGLVQKTKAIESYQHTVNAATALNDRVAAIKTIQSSQPKFSLLLDDLAKFTLPGTAITSIILTGDDTKPVQISASATSYNQAVSLRDALASSPRISGADIISVSGINGSFTVSITIGFKPGQAR